MRLESILRQLGRLRVIEDQMLSLMLSEVVSPPPQPPQLQAASAGTSPPAQRFPDYLLPSFIRSFARFRRARASSASASTSTTDTAANATSSRSPFRGISSPSDSVDGSAATPSSFLPSSSFPRNPTEQSDVPQFTKIHPDTIRCSTCGADIALHSQIVSKGFTGRYGRAYLIAPFPENSRYAEMTKQGLFNINIGTPESRILATGTHTVSDISCAVCRARIGWKYVDAKDESQKYKIGKFILETRRTVNHQHWEDITPEERRDLDVDRLDRYEERKPEAIVFDSGDEDECEDLFMGIWNTKTAAARRRLRQNKKK